jgi:hypothetical protein
LPRLDELIAGTGINTLLSTGTNDLLLAESGTDTLINDGASIADQFGSGPANELSFGSGVADNQLWFLRSGNDLQIDIMGSSSQVTVSGWFASTSNQLQEITAGGLEIDSGVSALVQAMATYSSANPSFNPTASGVTQAPSDATLQSAISSAWHH